MPETRSWFFAVSNQHDGLDREPGGQGWQGAETGDKGQKRCRVGRCAAGHSSEKVPLLARTNYRIISPIHRSAWFMDGHSSYGKSLIAC